MRDKKIKLIYFSLQGSEVKSFSLSWKRILSIMFSSFVVMLLMVGSTIALFTDFYKDQRISRLLRTNQALSNQLQHMSGKVNQLEGQIQGIEKQDDGLRLMAGLSRIDPDLRKVGTGGAYGDYIDVDLNSLPENLQDETKKVNVLLAELERRVTLHSENVNEVKDKLVRIKTA